jgi:hypothetical protein
MNSSLGSFPPSWRDRKVNLCVLLPPGGVVEKLVAKYSFSDVVFFLETFGR